MPLKLFSSVYLIIYGLLILFSNLRSLIFVPLMRKKGINLKIQLKTFAKFELVKLEWYGI